MLLPLYFTASTVLSAPLFTSCPTSFAPFSTALPVLVAAFSTALPVLVAAFSVYLAAVLAPFSVSFAATLVSFSVALAAVLVACPVFFAAISVSFPAVLAPFSVSFLAVLAVSFISVPVDFLSLLASCPTANAAADTRATTTINAHFIFMGFLLQIGDSCCEDSQYATSPEANQIAAERIEIHQRTQQPLRCSLLCLGLKRPQGLIVHFPLFQDGKDRFCPKTGPYHRPENTGGLLLILRLRQPLLAKILPRLFLLAYPVVSGVHGLINYRSMHSTRL